MQMIDAVIPLLPKDFERFTILIRSLDRFMTGLRTIYVVLPDRDVAHARLLPRARRFRMQIIGESSLVPEMSSFFYLPGWYKQQLVKLAAAEIVQSPFYLTFDADVICTRAVAVQDLLPGGRARCFVINKDEHPDWYAGAEAVLELPAKRRHVLHNVTPCVWSREGVLELISHLNEVARRRAYATGIRGLNQRFFFTLHRHGAHRKQPPWRGWLASSRPWAEYAMYFTYLEATGRFERYHVESNQCIYDVERSIWYKSTRIEDVDLDSLFVGSGPPYFIVVQSNTGTEAQRTWDRVREYIEPMQMVLEAPEPRMGS